MRIIAADIGNSSIKVAVRGSSDASDNRWVNKQVVRRDDPINFDLPDDPAFWATSSVNSKSHQRLADWVKQNRPQDEFHLIRHADIELESNVEERESVGIDRLVAAWMALQLVDQKGPVIVVDAGTAVTVDLVDHTNLFQGGCIFLGGAAELSRLSSSTDALPDLSQREYLKLLDGLTKDKTGKSTNEALVRGVYQGQIGAILHIVSQYKSDFPKAQVFATGGGIEEIRFGLPDDFNYVPDLVIRGAAAIGFRIVGNRAG